MKFCPMCGSSQSEPGLKICAWCDYEEKPLEELSEQELSELMAPYEFSLIEDGVRIDSVKNVRNIRGKIGIPHFVTEIAPEAFAGCKFLSRIGLPNNLRSIGDAAFADCRDLFDVFIPDSVSHMGNGVFADCYDLSVICCAASSQPDAWNSEWLSGYDAKVEWSSVEDM